jgi:hypothetical protein
MGGGRTPIPLTYRIRVAPLISRLNSRELVGVFLLFGRYISGSLRTTKLPT